MFQPYESSGMLTAFSGCSSEHLVLENPVGVFKRLYVVPVTSSRITWECDEPGGQSYETRIRNCGTPLYGLSWTGIPLQTGDDTPR